MKRCNDCADRVVDTDVICTGCRMAEWRDQQEQARLAREKAYALEAHRAAYLSRKKMVRDSIKAGVICAIGFLLFWHSFRLPRMLCGTSGKPNLHYSGRRVLNEPH